MKKAHIYESIEPSPGLTPPRLTRRYFSAYTGNSVTGQNEANYVPYMQNYFE